MIFIIAYSNLVVERHQAMKRQKTNSAPLNSKMFNDILWRTANNAPAMLA